MILQCGHSFVHVAITAGGALRDRFFMMCSCHTWYGAAEQLYLCMAKEKTLLQYGHVFSPAQFAVDVVVQLLVSESAVLL